MTERRLSIADFTDPAGAHERRRREDEIDLRRGELELRAQIESYRLRQDDAHHRDKVAQDERHHGDKMQALERADRLDAQRLGLVARRDAEQAAVNREHVAVSRERLELDREQFAAKMEAEREGAMIQAHASLALARVNHDGAIELAELGQAHAVGLSELNHRQTLALSELNHAQALGVMREQSQIANMDATTAIARDRILSTIRRGEATTKDLSGAIGAILVEKVKGRISEKLADQKEVHRENERKHEKEMAERAARFGRVGFTPEELVRAGFSIKEASMIVERLTSGIGPQNDEEAEVFGKFDHWHAHLKQQGR